jgi:hypothetical protein
MVGGQVQKGQGHAGLVVERALGGQGRPRGAQHRGAQLLGGGLADRAGHADDLRVHPPPDRTGDLPEGHAGVVDLDAAQVGRQVARRASALDQEAERAGGQGLGAEVVTVVVLADDGHIEAGPGLAAVDGHAGKAAGTPSRGLAGGRGDHLVESHLGHR